MEIFVNQGKDSTIEPSYLSKTFSDKSGGPILIHKDINENGDYSALSDGADGYSSVTANVETYEDTLAKLIDRSITSINIPNGVMGIGDNAFKACISLKQVDIPSSVTIIRGDAFSGCQSLNKIIINKPENSISGAPWGAPNSPQIIWTGE